MSDDVMALVAGALLAVGALAFVLQPLFMPPTRAVGATRSRAAPGDDSAIRALREIEFDRATGKLSDADYAALRRDYAARAVQEMRAAAPPPAEQAVAVSPAAAARPAPPVDADPIERRVRAYRETHRECPTCGIRPEPDAIYCSTCGTFLDGRCPRCGADVVGSAAEFCSRCGAALTRAAVP